ncbi:MAG: NAD-glutamate dehydrogenase [bacterium]
MTTDQMCDEASFAVRYLAHVGTQLPGYPQAYLDAVAREHHRFGDVRRPEATLVRVRTVNTETSAVEIVTADAPYLVDSVRSELKVTGHPVENLLHPHLVVTRDDDGRLLAVHDIADTAELPDGATGESWMYAEIPAVPASEQEEIAAGLRAVLTDVHHAVDDAPVTYALIRALADTLTDDPGQFDRETSAEAGSLLRWLADGNFMILGHAAYSANELAGYAPAGSGGRGAGPRMERAVSGVLRGNRTVSALELLPAYRSGAPVVVFKSPLMSTVLRAVRYDCVSVVAPGAPGESAKIHVFLGLFDESADAGVSRVPVLRRRVKDVLAHAGVRANSYTGRQLVAALRTLPRDELLEADSADLLNLATLVANRAERGGIGVFSRVHLNRDFVSVLVYLPAERLGPETVRQVREVVAERWPGSLIDRENSISDLGLARLHYLVTLRPGEPVPTPDYREVEARITEVTRRWGDDLADLLLLATSEQEGQRLIRRYDRSFPEAYKEDFPAATAVRDIRRLEQLPAADGLAFDLYTPPASDPASRRLKILRTGTHISLARALPLLSYLGIEVLDERPYEIDRHDGGPAWIYDFGLGLPPGVDLEPEDEHEAGEDRVANLLEALRRLWRGDVEPDRFNELVLRAGLTWRQVTILRAYAKYLRQAGSQYSQGYVEQALIDHPRLARRLAELFEARFDPAAEVADLAQDDPAAPAAITADIREALGSVASLDQDRILRSLMGLILATLRTNAFRVDLSASPNRPSTVEAAAAATSGTAVPAPSGRTGDAADDPPSIRWALAFKLDPHQVDGLPQPLPRFEVWVYSPSVEGVHLRFGPVARGGLRWSDRREDFRTEVLGLVKAQMIKNAVIVPVGAKGGFVAKQLPDPALDRDASAAEGVACYRAFVSALLDITDNYVTDAAGHRAVQPPPRVRRYDSDDPYLVVAADKGTARFSDVANVIAVQRRFWLGDAFASGGSVGYDHKAMGITARGAWRSVEYHFREREVDVATQRVTVVGIGDMSGDVFGNGMLLSDQLRLVAAFDHRHVFLDPDPDPGVAFAERKRLAALPGSSWADYDPQHISAGGGVYARTLKTIPVSPPVAERLGLSAGTTELAPADLMRAVLCAPVDLLWNGGIGTYVKATTETNVDVGDKANDPIRVDAAQLRCRVVGEGGNLGFTQLGRIEFARGGGGINTDAIDNSAGVDTSDHEVNIKILLDQAVAAGSLEHRDRNRLLGSCADEVAAAVLRDNYEQNVLLGLERRLAGPMVGVYGRLLRDLEGTARLDRGLEFLPTDKELVQREVAGLGLLSPELAVALAYVKINLTERLIDSGVPDSTWLGRALAGYFPHSIAERFAGSLRAHPLHRDIVVTSVVNDMVNRAGTTFAFRAVEETGADSAQVTLAYTITREVFDLESLWRDIEALDNQVSTEAQDAAYFDIRRLADRATRWLIDVRYPLGDVGAEIDRFRPAVRELSDRVPRMLRGDERLALQSDVDRLVTMGVPTELATRIATLLSAYLLLDVVEIAAERGRPAEEVAQLHFTVSERFSVDRMLTAVTALPRVDRWSALARAALRHDVYAALSAITSAVLRTTGADQPAEERLRRWESANAERVARARNTVAEALGRDTCDLATLSVALRVMRGLPT